MEMIFINKTKPTAYNRSVNAPPPIRAAPGFGFARSVAALVPTQNLTQIASRSVSGWQLRLQPSRYMTFALTLV